jgi:hypothetical protein
MDERGSIPEGGNEEIVFYYRVQTGSGAYPASYPMGTGDAFHEGKATGA